MSDQKKKGQEEKKAEKLAIGRRRFLATLAAASGGALIYGKPGVAQEHEAEASPTSTSVRNVFDIDLPASYGISEEVVIDVVRANGTTEPVPFSVQGGVTLNPTTDPDVAVVIVDAFDMTGVDDPSTTATLAPGTVIGQLNLRSGGFAENNFPVTIGLLDGEQVEGEVQPTGATVEEKKEGDKKCNKENDVEVSVEPTPALLGASGHLSLGLTPTLVGEPTVNPV